MSSTGRPTPSRLPINFGQGYKALPTNVEARKERPGRALLFRALAFTSIMVVLLSGLRYVTRSGLPKCMGGRPHRTITSLPSHYTLPSGRVMPHESENLIARRIQETGFLLSLLVCLLPSISVAEIDKTQASGAQARTRSARRSR